MNHMSKELRQRLAKEYRHAVTRMQESPQAAKKLYYFSVFFGEAQRVLNWEWDRDLALVYAVTTHIHQSIVNILREPALAEVLPIDWATILDKLTQVASALTTYFEKPEDESSAEELLQMLGQFAEIAYAVLGNGSYLHEKGLFSL